MKKMLYFLLITIFLSCNNNAQNSYVFNKIPLDTSKWVATDTLLIKLNDDNYIDAVLIFDKYRGLTRPNNILTPVVFYLGIENENFSLIEKSVSIIYSPYFEAKVLNDEFIIIQKGMENDNNIYTNFFKYQDNKIVMIRAIVEQKIEKLKVDEQTGDVTTIVERVDTIYNKSNSIPLNKYNFIDFVKGFKN